jgi:EmrB/QacA subfamily drug resistance transporter
MNPHEGKPLLPVLITTLFASFMNPFMMSAINIALPDIQKQFAASAFQLGWVTNAFLLANAIVLLPLSKASDRWGRVQFFRLGLYAFFLFTLLTALSPNIEFLLLFRAMQGMGAALMQVTGMAIITAAYPPQKRGAALGLNVGAVYTGLSTGPFLGGLLTHYGGWQMILYAVLPLGLLTILLANRYLQNNHAKPLHYSFDFRGSIFLGLALIGIIYGGGKLPSLDAWIIWVTGILFLVVFFLYENRIKHPILDIRMMRSNRLFTYSAFASLIHYSATFGVSFLLSLYLQISKGLSPREAGMVLVVQPLIMVVTAPLAGKISDKIRPGLIASAGMVLTLFGLVGLIFLEPTTNHTTIVALLVFLGLGFGFFTSPNTNAIMGSVEKKDYGLASGITATMRIFGQTFSMMLVSIFISFHIGQRQLSPETLPHFMITMKYCFLIFSFLCIPGIYLSIRRNK